MTYHRICNKINTTCVISRAGTAYLFGAPGFVDPCWSFFEEHKTQGPKEKVQKDKQRSTKHTYKIKDQVTRTSQKSG
jgi:hypothetical protein